MNCEVCGKPSYGTFRGVTLCKDCSAEPRAAITPMDVARELGRLHLARSVQCTYKPINWCEVYAIDRAIAKLRRNSPPGTIVVKAYLS